MSNAALELAKVAALAAAIGLGTAYFASPVTGAFVGVVALWLLLARIT